MTVDLIVRGFSCLRPAVAGLTDNVRLRSVIGRFLEHSRIFFFANGSDDPFEGHFFIGSADWMQRNLSKRVEAITPVEPRALCERLWEVLTVILEDSRQAWHMQPDGTYTQLQPPEHSTGPAAIGTHLSMMQLTRRRLERHE